MESKWRLITHERNTMFYKDANIHTDVHIVDTPNELRLHGTFKACLYFSSPFVCK